MLYGYTVLDHCLNDKLEEYKPLAGGVQMFCGVLQAQKSPPVGGLDAIRRDMRDTVTGRG
jgi:hypothetical protein